jgi:hypothetical protein
VAGVDGDGKVRKPILGALFAFLALAFSASAQEKSDKFAIFVTGLDDATPVVRSLIKQLNAAEPFEAVTKNDSSKVTVLVVCMPRKQTEPFVCMYVSQLNGPTLKTFLGGGLFFSMDAEAVARDFLTSVSQDILERIDDTNKANLRQALESCLLMTDSKCNVPGPLQKEFGANQLTLGQYLFQKHE